MVRIPYRYFRGCTFLILLLLPFHSASAQLLERLEQEFVKRAETARRGCVRVDVERMPQRTDWEGIVLEGNKFRLKSRGLEGPISLSGILLDPEGNVATVGQALVGAYRVSVSQFDGKELHSYKADVVGYDLDSNIGLVRIKNAGRPLEGLPLGDSNAVRQGALVMGLGYNYNLGASPSFSVGIVSATDRLFRMTDRKPDTQILFQTSLALHAGESGGPMVSTSMEVVGLLLTTFHPSIPSSDPEQGGEVIPPGGFTLVVPINKVKEEVEGILTRQDALQAWAQKIQDPWLGFRGEPVRDRALRKRFMIPEGGVLVSYVFPGDPADEAGIQENDVLTAWNDTRIQGLDHLKDLIGQSKVGEQVWVLVVREGKEQKIQVRIGSY